VKRHSCLVAVIIATACAASNPSLYPIRDESGRVIEPDPNSCLASVAARRYIYEMRQKLLGGWQPPTNHRGKFSVTFFIRVADSGELKQVYTEAPEDPVHASALAAFKRAAPFSPVPPEAICLTEEQFMATFSFEAR